MYREAIAHSIRRGRPGLDVRRVPPEDAGRELDTFRPHLIVYNDTAPIPGGALADVSWRVEIRYSDSLSARVWANGSFSEYHDMTTEDLLRTVDGATDLEGCEATGG